MVTIEDLIEEIVGDVRDEHDDATPDVGSAGSGWRVSGLLRIDEVSIETGYRAPEGEYETIGGLVSKSSATSRRSAKQSSCPRWMRTACGRPVCGRRRWFRWRPPD